MLNPAGSAYGAFYLVIYILILGILVAILVLSRRRAARMEELAAKEQEARGKLQEMNQRLEEAMRNTVAAEEERRSLYRETSFELRTGISSIIGLAEKLRAEVGSSDTAADSLDKLESTARRLIEQAENLQPSVPAPEVSPADAVSPEAAEPVEEFSFTGRTILVAEDNELNMEIIRFMLEDAGADVVPASDGLKAIDAFSSSKEGSLDAILMDIVMPGLDGLSASRTIRAMSRKDAADIPIIAMSANEYDKNDPSIINSGISGWLRKPLDFESVQKAISENRPHK